MGFFRTVSHWGGGGGGMRAQHHNFIVVAPMLVTFGTGVKYWLEVFYTMATNNCDVTIITSLLHHYDIITCILSDT